MKKIVVWALLGCFACKNDVKKETELKVNTPEITAKTTEDYAALKVYDNFDSLEPLLNIKDDKVHVVNFWATWCAPCVKELPHFEKLRTVYAKKGVDVLLVSLDFPNAFETKLKPFIANQNIQSSVVVLNDPDSNTWIPKIESSWSGSIPVTIIYKNNIRKFYETPFTYEALEKELHTFLE
ncbi:TlpA disulfide reductase family protein [Formosa algae]|uniref:Thiol-disulfide isomerase/thioredoxin n=1 Tax=Formosa algae TaxID=225843 RepID=A0A9X1CBM8_9FLAO|nr:TlpA disulfide reductase family protein [Formosa algae]MBP1839390.1 thiol-disulfide isomerase/thioredoxin [Formosa algae]MDQ0334694.1 thiol-disulfide isomerase/thioredoxin [Formosa algae]OEI81277.1 thioredoxin [Formosa algae]PNW27782.1 thioredoxin [Formosa algae]